MDSVKLFFLVKRCARERERERLRDTGRERKRERERVTLAHKAHFGFQMHAID